MAMLPTHLTSVILVLALALTLADPNDKIKLPFPVIGHGNRRHEPGRDAGGNEAGVVPHSNSDKTERTVSDGRPFFF